MNRESILDWLGRQPLEVIIAGLLGGVVRWITLRSNWKEGFGQIVVGAICAFYLGDYAVPIVENTIGKIVEGGSPKALGSFLVGMGGLTLAGLVMDAFNLARQRAQTRQEDDR